MISNQRDLYSNELEKFVPTHTIFIDINLSNDAILVNIDFNTALSLLRLGANIFYTINSGTYKILTQITNVQFDDNSIVINAEYTYSNTRKRDLVTWNQNGITRELLDNIVYPQYYNIGTIISKILSNGTNEEVLNAINSIFTNFNGFKTAVGKPNSVFYNDIYGNFNLRANNYVLVFWATYDSIQHVVINEDGSYIHNTIQIVDQTLYRLSNLTIEPIVNPKIWVGTATQYAAIAQKDNNTTYIVKSDA